jgi:hypothetical protein
MAHACHLQHSSEANRLDVENCWNRKALFSAMGMKKATLAEAASWSAVRDSFRGRVPLLFEQ